MHSNRYQSVSCKPEEALRWKAPSVLCRVRDYLACNPVDQPERCGVVMYNVTRHKSNSFQIKVGLGLDERFRELADFGGQRSHGDANPIETAIREFREETLGLFEELQIEDVLDCYLIYDCRNLVLFLHTDIPQTSISERYNLLREMDVDRRRKIIRKAQLANNRSRVFEYPEIRSIVWLPWMSLVKLARRQYRGYPPIFRRLQSTINSHPGLFTTLATSVID